jgi:hypothetical protein
MEFPPVIREVYFQGTAQIFRKLNIELIQKITVEKKPRKQAVPTSCKIAQDVEDWVQSGKGIKLPAFERPEEYAVLPRMHERMLGDLQEDFYNYWGWDRVKEDTNDKGTKIELIRENDEELLEMTHSCLEKEKEKNFERIKRLQIEQDQKKSQNGKMQEFIDLSWSSWIEDQKEESQNRNLGSQRNQLRDSTESQNFQIMIE